MQRSAGFAPLARGYPDTMDIALAVIAVVVVAIAVLLVVSARRRRAAERDLRRGKLDGVVAGHREMVDSHHGSLAELRPLAQAHRQQAVEHTRKAEELEQRIEREERHARFHEDRAAATEREREQV